MERNRNVNYDLMRLVCMIGVIMYHTPVKPFAYSILGTTILAGLLLPSNGIFYMISGRLNLTKVFLSKEDMIRYYKMRIVSILVPYVLVSFLLSLVKNIQANEPITFLFLFNAYKDIMSANIITHLWFMYPLIGFLLSTPFLSRMLHALNDREVKLLFYIALVWNVFSCYLGADTGAGFSYLGWILGDWMLLYFLGYYSHRIIKAERRRWYYLAGMIGFVVTIAGRMLIPEHFQYWADLQPGYILFTLAMFLFWENGIHIKNKKIGALISYSAKYSFLIYMVHWSVMYNLVFPIVKVDQNWLHFLLTTALTLVFSFGISWLLDLVLKPLKKLTSRILRV